MAVQTDVTISIGNTQIEDFLSITLSQQVLNHHHLNITVRKDLLEADLGIFKESQSLIGKAIKLGIKANSGEETEFQGVVYELKTIRSNQYTGDIIQIHAVSPDITMNDVPDYRSFENKTLSEIVEAVFGDYGIANKDVAPKANPKLVYTVQFKESGFGFVRRLAIRHGQWFLYDGKVLHFGALPKKSTKLEFGKDLFSFELSQRLNPFQFGYVSHDFMNHKIDAVASDDATRHIPKLGKAAHDSSGKIFKYAPNHFFQGSFYEKPGKTDLTEVTTLKKGAAAAGLFFCSGSSDDPNVMLGGTIEVFENEMNHGKFTVVQLTHYTDRNGNYKNEFQAVPFDIENPPYTDPDIMMLAEPHSGKVTDNYDPDGLSRVRVEMFWQQSKKLKTPWLRIATPYAGKDKGFHFIPEIDEEVLVGFEGGNPERPFVMASLYQGQAKPDKRWQTDKNDFKTIRSRSGHTIEFIDKQGAEEIKIYDDAPDKYTYSITLASHSKQIIIVAKGDLKIKADNIKITAQNDFTVKAKNIRQSADDEIELNADKEFSAKATTKMSLDGGMKLDQKASAKVAINGGGQLDLKGGIVKIN